MASQDDFIKKPYQTEAFTTTQAKEMLKCAQDPIYFCENYVKVQNPKYGAVPFVMYDYQKEAISLMRSPRAVLLQARQTGKCVEYDTLIKIKSPLGVEYEMKIGDFYNWLAYCRWFKTNMDH